ncbi:hypothetical protein EPN44_09220 [bacterium]|nr:MAG: hypothetical protein EPN44_09220 [bacterium]
MMAIAPSRGWNYHGSINGQAYTFTLYADPVQAGTTSVVLLSAPGILSNATGGLKEGAMTVASTGSGATIGAYTIYNFDGTTYSNGGLPSPQLVPSTLTPGQTFSPYVGMSATVTTVGAVPGASACPNPATGASVQYSYLGQSYQISYVPGCGMTQYVGNHGETFTLASIGSYPQLGTLGDVRQMASLTLFDTVKSAARILAAHEMWRSPFSRR